VELEENRYGDDMYLLDTNRTLDALFAVKHSIKKSMIPEVCHF